MDHTKHTSLQKMRQQESHNQSMQRWSYVKKRSSKKSKAPKFSKALRKKTRTHFYTSKLWRHEMGRCSQEKHQERNKQNNNLNKRSRQTIYRTKIGQNGTNDQSNPCSSPN